MAINPLIIYDVGFILSFVGTLGIVLLANPLINFLKNFIKSKFISETIGVTLAAQIMLFPIMAYYFNTVSLLSLITNFLVVPISGFLTILGFITVIVGMFSLKLSSIIAFAIYTMISGIFKIASFFGNITWANLLIPTPKVWMIICYYLVVFSFVKLKRKRKLVLKIVMFISIFYFILNQIPKSYVSLNMIDVGQGDSIYIETRNGKTILIDGGGSESSDYDVGENIVVPYLLDKGKMMVDLVIVSHPHEDHIEGILTVVEKLKVKTVIVGMNLEKYDLQKELIEICEKRGTKIIEVGMGDSFKIDGVDFSIFYPKKDLKEENINNMSLVIKMEYGEVTTLFTGDLEGEGEELLKGDIKADILKVSHHGSNTSTTENFLRKVLPKLALISVGIDNSYGHPSDLVLDRLKSKNIDIYRTDIRGEIMLKIFKNGKMEMK